MMSGKKLEKYQKIVVKLHFESTQEFEGLFTRKTLSVTRSIVEGISKAMEDNKRSALLFQLTFSNCDEAYEISLPQSQWVQSLQSCLDHLHAQGLADEQIDCWKLLEAAKTW